MAGTIARTAAPAAQTATAVKSPSAPVAPPRAPVSIAPPLRSAPPAVRLGSAANTSGLSGGAPLSPAIQTTLAHSFQADLQAVRVHSDTRAHNAAANVSARAFTYGNHIFLGRGEGANNLGLLAHETAHVIQQRSAPTLQMWTLGQSDSYEREAQQASEAAVRGESFTVSERTSSTRVQRLGLSDILDGLANLAANLPGFTLLTVIIGRNPINLRVVERNFTNLLRGFMGLIPGGEILFQVLNRYGVVERIGNWVSDQVSALGINYDYLRGRFTAFTDSLSWRDIFSPGDVWRRAENIFAEPITRIRNFISRLVSQAVTWLKETFMQPLSNFCREIPGYTLVTVLLGRDPFTNAAVPRTALNVVRAFAEFIPGGTEKVNQLVESRALQRAYEWFTQETQARNLTWARVTGTFAQAWNSLRLEDVLSPIETLQRMVTMFRPLMSDLISFAGAALMKLLELIFEAVMGAGGARILAILKRARATFLTIIQNPVGFLRNLLGAVGQGVRQFMTNILRHLRDGVIAWLTGPVAAAGIQMPEQWDMRGIIWFVMQILGLTWGRVRQKLVRLMGERAVAMLEQGFQLIQEIREKGLVQALRDRVTEFFGQLREAALGGIKSFIQQRLVMAGIQQLLSLLSPVGAVIQAIIKTYTTIQFFIQRINQILDFVESIVNSIAAIASGAIGAAANLVERTMARTIPIILDFLARFIGLGDVGGQVQSTIRGLQARVDGMLDRAVDWIRTQARALLQRAAGGTPQERLDQALTAGLAVVNRFAGRRIGALVLRPLLSAIRVRYQLTSLEPVEDGGYWAVEGAASPRRRGPRSQAQAESGRGLTPQQIGEAIAPVLAAVEQRWLAELESQESETSSSRMERAQERVRAGGPATNSGERGRVRLPRGLSREQEIRLLREIERGDIEINVQSERSMRAAVFLQGGTEQRGGMYVNDPRNQGRTFIPGGGEYDTSIPRHVAAIEEQVRRAGGTQADVLRQLSPTRQRLARVLEPAREEGMLVARRLGEELVMSDQATAAEITHGNLAPMAFRGATGNDPAAVRLRQTRTGNLIQRLRNSAMRAEILDAPGGNVLQRLGSAVERWLEANFRPTTDDRRLESETRRLEGALLAFLRRFQGGN